MEILWREIEIQIDKLLIDDSFSLNNLAVVIADEWGLDKLVLDFLMAKFQNKGVCAAKLISSVKGASKIEVNTADQKRGVLMLYPYDQVSSLEWPVVIYVSCSDGKATNSGIEEYMKYRACSRATGKLIEIIVMYGDVKHKFFRSLSEGHIYLGKNHLDSFRTIQYIQRVQRIAIHVFQKHHPIALV